MAWWAWALIVIYLIGFILIFAFHMFYLQMVTFELALLRSLLWPVWVTTGIPRGTPLTMD